MTVEEAIASLTAYRGTGRPCGGFLMAVLENNLSGAMQFADESSAANLGTISYYVYWNMPADCWGSPAKVAAWQAARRAEREASA